MNLPLLALMGTLVWKLLDFAKYFRAKDWNGVFTQAAAWGAGVAVVFLGSATDFATVHINDMALGDLNYASKILLGMLATSLLSVGYDFKKAFDRSDSAQTPALLTGEYAPVNVGQVVVSPAPPTPAYTSPVGEIQTKDNLGT